MNDDWFEKAMDEAFDSPQARMVAHKLAAAEAAKRAEERGRIAEAERNRIPASTAANMANQFAAVAEGKLPMNVPATPAPRPRENRPQYQYPSVTPITPPRPGQSGAISYQVAIEVIRKTVRESPDPRAKASELLSSITQILIEVANEADPDED